MSIFTSLSVSNIMDYGLWVFVVLRRNFDFFCQMPPTENMSEISLKFQ